MGQRKGSEKVCLHLLAETEKSAEETVREMKKSQKSSAGEDYREKSLAINSLVCARCGREFPESQRQLLTVHHKDGNHNNNPADGSNWENLCVYCHEDVHSRGVLAEYLGIMLIAGRSVWSIMIHRLPSDPVYLPRN